MHACRRIAVALCGCKHICVVVCVRQESSQPTDSGAVACFPAAACLGLAAGASVLLDAGVGGYLG